MKKLYQPIPPLLPSRLLWNLVALAISASLLNNVAKAEEAPQRYQVEVIVFEHLALKGWTEEYWPMTVEIPNIEQAQNFSTTNTAPLYLKNSPSMLATEAAKVAKNYRILYQKSWTQNALDKPKTPNLLIEGANASTQFFGTVKMYQSRFNHIMVDLNFDRLIPNQVREAFAQMQKMNVNELPAQWSFHIKDQRKVKSGELHYIDHPLFGVLVQVQKID